MARFIVGVPDPLLASITPAQNPPRSDPQVVSQATQGTAVLTSSVAAADITFFGNALPLHTPNAYEEFRKAMQKNLNALRRENETPA